MRNAPSQVEDDLQFEKDFSEYGEQSYMAGLMLITPMTFKRMVTAADSNHPSDYYRGRRLAYAAGYRGDEKGERIKRGFDEAFEAGKRDAGHLPKAKRFDGAQFIDSLTKPIHPYMQGDKAEMVRALTVLISEATAFREALLSGEVEGFEADVIAAGRAVS